MTMDNELVLIGKTGYSTNTIGDAIPTETKTTVLCGVKSITRTEHYQAAAHGLKPELVFVVNKYEYEGQKEVEFEGERYNVLRTYEPKTSKGLGDFETLELVCEGVVNRANA